MSKVSFAISNCVLSKASKAEMPVVVFESGRAATERLQGTLQGFAEGGELSIVNELYEAYGRMNECVSDYVLETDDSEHWSQVLRQENGLRRISNMPVFSSPEVNDYNVISLSAYDILLTQSSSLAPILRIIDNLKDPVLARKLIKPLQLTPVNPSGVHGYVKGLRVNSAPDVYLGSDEWLERNCYASEILEAHKKAEPVCGPYIELPGMGWLAKLALERKILTPLRQVAQLPSVPVQRAIEAIQ